MQLSHQCQREVISNLMCHPVFAQSTSVNAYRCVEDSHNEHRTPIGFKRSARQTEAASPCAAAGSALCADGRRLTQGVLAAPAQLLRSQAGTNLTLDIIFIEEVA